MRVLAPRLDLRRAIRCFVSRATASCLAIAAMLLATPAAAVDQAVQVECPTWSGAAWDPVTKTCTLLADRTIESSVNLSVGPDITLVIQSGVRLRVATAAALINTGFIRSAGTIENDGALQNFGALRHVLPSASYTGTGSFAPGGNNGVVGDLSTAVAANRFGPSTVNIHVLAGDTLRILDTATFSVPTGYRFLIAGTVAIENGGSFAVGSGATTENSAAITNNGSLANSGTFYNRTGATIDGNAIDNRAGGTLYNLGAIGHTGPGTNAGTVENGYYFGVENPAATITLANNSSISNSGTFRNYATVTLPIVGASFINDGVLENLEGNIEIGVGAGFGSPSLTNNATGTVSNQATIDIVRGTILNRSGATFNNTNRVELSGNGLLDNAGTWNNNGPAVLQSAGRIQNAGNITNQIVARIENTGSVLSDSGTIVNRGTIVNGVQGRFNSSAPVQNYGTFDNDHGRLEIWAAFDNFGTLENDGFPDPDDPENGYIFNYATITNATGGRIVNREVISNWAAVSNSGIFQNLNQLENNAGASLTNPGSVDNQGIVNNYRDASIATSGSFANNVLNAFCGGTVSGTITGNPATSNCEITGSGNVLTVFGNSCANVGGRFEQIDSVDLGRYRACVVDNLTVSGSLEVSAFLHIRGVLTTTGNEGLMVRNANKIVILPGASFQNGARLLIGYEAKVWNLGTMVSTARIETGSFSDLDYPNPDLAGGTLINRGRLELQANGIRNGYEVINEGELFVADGAFIRNAREPSPRFVTFLNTSSGSIENRGEFSNGHMTKLYSEGRFDNHGLIQNGYAEPEPDNPPIFRSECEVIGSVLDGDYSRWGCTINVRASGVLNNYGTIRNARHGQITGSNNSRVQLYPDSRLESEGKVRFEDQALFRTDVDSFFENFGLGVVEFFSTQAADLFGALRNLGTASFWAGVGADIRNLFSFSFHNEGLYFNSGTLDNTNGAAATGGLFENLGTFVNADGLIRNGNGTFLNGSASVTSAQLRNTGRVEVGSGQLQNFGSLQNFSGGTVQGTVTGAPAASVANAAPIVQTASASGTRGQPVVLTLAGSDADNNPLAYRIVGAEPANGFVELVGNRATYHPRSDFVGTDHFQFLANDGSIDSNLGEATVEISANQDADLASLGISPGDLLPTFSGEITDYRALIDQDVTSVAVNAVAVDPEATVFTHATRSLTSPVFVTELDETSIEIEVVAADTTTTRTYSLLVTRATDSYAAPTAVGSGNAKTYLLAAGSACTFTRSAFIASIPGAVPATPVGVVFPHGLLDAAIGGCSPGAAVNLTTFYPRPLTAPTQFWKWGPTPDDATPHWYVLPALVDGASATITITDGGLGDDDLTANGTIVLRGGASAQGTTGGGGPPAVVQPLQIPALHTLALALLAALLALGAMRAQRGE